MYIRFWKPYASIEKGRCSITNYMYKYITYAGIEANLHVLVSAIDLYIPAFVQTFLATYILHACI